MYINTLFTFSTICGFLKITVENRYFQTGSDVFSVSRRFSLNIVFAILNKACEENNWSLKRMRRIK